MNWNDLSDLQKEQYKKYCDSKYGETNAFCEKQPLYFNDQGLMIDTKIVLDLLFSENNN